MAKHKIEPKRPLLSVIIPTYSMNRYKDLCDLLLSLKNQTISALEIIIVIEKSDRLYESIKSFVNANGMANVTLIQTNILIGCSFQVNLGVRQSNASIIAYLHDDTVVDKYWAETIIQDFENDDQIFGVSGPIVPSSDSPEIPWFPQNFDWIIGCNRYFVRLMKKKKKVRSVSGSNASFRKQAFEAAGGLMKTLGPLTGIKSRWLEIGEETELCLRMAKNVEGNILYDPTVVVYHKIPSENLRYRFIARMSFQAGRTKGGLKALYKTDDDLLKPEGELLRDIFVTLLPTVIVELFNKPIIGLRRSLVIGISLGFLAFGFITGYLVPSSFFLKTSRQNSGKKLRLSRHD